VLRVCPDEKGCTALHVAAQLNYVDIGKLLVDSGCRVDIVGEVELDDEDDEAPPAAPPGGPAAAAAQMMTAAECARRLGNTAFVDMLAAAKPKN
jgi:ankyrin repeat protein